MLDSDTDNDKGTPNAIKLAGNSCGCIMEIDVDSSMNAVSAKMLVCGTPQSVTGDPNACIVDGIANPDNVAMIPDYKQLLIGEDTSKHDNNLVWVYDLHSGDLTRVASVPTGAETTSPYWFTVGDWSYISMVAQHPDDMDAYVGYIGPFPVRALPPLADWRELRYPEGVAKTHVLSSPLVSLSSIEETGMIGFDTLHRSREQLGEIGHFLACVRFQVAFERVKDFSFHVNNAGFSQVPCFWAL